MDCLGLLDGMFVQLAFNSVYPFVKQVLNASQCRPEWQARGGTFFQAPKKILDSLPRWQSELHGRTTYNTCALTYFFPVKSRKGAIFFLSDLPSRSHFRYLETSTSRGLEKVNIRVKNPIWLREKNFSFQQERRIRSLTY